MTIEVALNDGGARVLVEVTFPQCSLSTLSCPSRSVWYGRRTPVSGRRRYGEEAPGATVPEARRERVSSTQVGRLTALPTLPTADIQG